MLRIILQEKGRHRSSESNSSNEKKDEYESDKEIKRRPRVTGDKSDDVRAALFDIFKEIRFEYPSIYFSLLFILNA